MDSPTAKGSDWRWRERRLPKRSRVGPSHEAGSSMMQEREREAEIDGERKGGGERRETPKEKRERKNE